jgi:hypothetical protein
MNTIKLNTIGERPIKKSGASGGGGGGNYVYYNKPSDGNLIPLVQFASVGKVNKNGIIVFLPATQTILYGIDSDNILALGFDMSLKVTDFETLKLVTIGEILDAIGEDLPRLTEEEFYKVAPDPWAGPTLNVTRYNGEIVTINYEEGMTWYEWCNSELNNTEFICYQNDDKGTIHFGDGSSEMIINADFAGDYPSYKEDTIKTIDVISKDINYTTYWFE